MTEIRLGDALDVLRSMPDCSVDALVTDPPAGIAFMGKDWDKDKGGRKEWIAWLSSIMGECLRVMKPGAHGLVWALPRTSHWTATALEDAGFEIRDVVTHLFGTGFPKQTSSLKPSSEHWILVRKGKSGVLQIDAVRIGSRKDNPQVQGAYRGSLVQVAGPRTGGKVYDMGRWPANTLFSWGEAQEELERQAPGASKFFYVAKPSPQEKHAGIGRNTHPTVKPIRLMHYLIRLITPPGGTVLDPFTGSGTTGVAAKQGGFSFIGIEREAEYHAIAQARISAA